MQIRQGLVLVPALLVLLAAGCATGGSGSSGTDTTRITAEEIAGVEVFTLYEVVQRIRPRWLEVRAVRGAFGGTGDTAVVVYMDRTLLGGVDELRRLGKDAANWLEYMGSSEAQARLPGIGSRHVEGAIVIHTTARGGP